MKFKTPLHKAWHKRVEGQIKHTLNEHPEYVSGLSSSSRNSFIRSLAKRIVGEIIAEYGGGPKSP